MFNHKLAHLPLGMMAGKLQTKCNFVKERSLVLIMFVIEICSLGCDWWETIIGLDNGLGPSGDKPLSEPTMTRFSNVYMRH